MALFSREGDDLNIHEMQTMWYELEIGEAKLRAGDIQAAVEEFSRIEKHINDMFEGQQDFHLYSMRKMALRSYVHFLKFGDDLVNNKDYVRAAIGLLRCHNLSPESFDAVSARRLAKKLVRHHPNNILVQEMSFEVFLRDGKFVLALKALLLLKSHERFSEWRESLLARISQESTPPIIIQLFEHFREQLY